MKRLPALLTAILLAMAFGFSTARADVILSELCDPQSNYPTDRFIEIYNSGPGAVDLTGWSVIAVANGVDALTWPLSGTIAAGQAKVCGYTAPVTGFTVDFQDAAWTTTVAGQGSYNWNGKVGDGAKLKNDVGTVIDLVLATGDLFNDRDMVRNSDVGVPNPAFTLSEWTITPVTLATDGSPGSHNGSVPVPGPKIADIITDPAMPQEAVGTHVQASVVDTSGPIASVSCAWGTTSGSLANSIPMELLSDSTYRTMTQIPGQPAGATIYYKVQAVGAFSNSASSILSFTIPGDGGNAPTIVAVGEMSDSTLLVQFSEPVEKSSAETPSNYTVGALPAVAAMRDAADSANVLITVRNIPAGPETLTVNGVADTAANVAYGITHVFTYIDVSIPPGYYDGTAGLTGSALRVALHDIIRNHTVTSYSYALTAFATTDVKPNGKIWDMYSDVPGGTPPYEYNVGQTGQGGSEGLGYNREHSFPQSWFGGASPMYSDLWILYPTDSYVNGVRANYPYGEVGVATYTSLNGSKLGPSVSPGYSGTVFEPIDGYKGDLARGMFYIATRYLGEDAGWPGSPSASGSQWLPWAAEQYLAWSNGDAVSWKERLRNGAIYTIQHNRNPFVDHPEFVAAIYDTAGSVGVEPGLAARTVRLRQNAPNPFMASTSIRFDIARRVPVSLRIYDVTGRRVRVLVDGRAMEPGSHAVEWNGRDDRGALLKAGLYLCRLDAGTVSETKRIVFTR